jgi:hypothetical protein
MAVNVVLFLSYTLLLFALSRMGIMRETLLVGCIATLMMLRLSIRLLRQSLEERIGR